MEAANCKRAKTDGVVVDLRKDVVDAQAALYKLHAVYMKDLIERTKHFTLSELSIAGEYRSRIEGLMTSVQLESFNQLSKEELSYTKYLR